MAWLSIDERDNLPDALVADLMRAIEVRFPDVCRSVTRLLDEQHAGAPARSRGCSATRLSTCLSR